MNRIPKIIHYCWLSDDPVPAELQKYMQSWKKYLSGYEFMLWNFDRFDKNSSIWVKEAFDSKKYAFAADYIRCYALYHYGGIYLDMDVEVLKPFDDLLGFPYFFCREYAAPVEAAVVGVEKHSAIFADMLKYYEDRHFIRDDGSFDTVALPFVMQKVLQQSFSLINIKSMADFDDSPDKICILPCEYFSPKSFTGKISTTDNSYTIHHYAGSWVGGWKKIKKKLFKIMGYRLTTWCLSLKAFLVGKKSNDNSSLS